MPDKDNFNAVLDASKHLDRYFDDYLRKEKYARTQDQILRLLLKTYGTQAVVEWGIGSMVSLRPTEVLQPRMYESSVSTEAKNRNGLYGRSLPSKTVVTEWLLRDMRKQQECGCSSQGRQLLEQQFRKLTEVVPELPHKRASCCGQMFNMWQEGKGIWLLQQTLYQIQEIWKSFMGEWEGGDGMKEVSDYVVRRLTPL